ncbi:hypothetical protein VHUM_01344 [Vanrija humicola]|uniref:U three protein 23 n=1 Tax=Vanrija humicola TaxID=5417 RepID=A0A7D8V1I7_VANHU|nr:hypothetical protein VHUM_01344 [Vanrija humicola]
MRQKRAKAYKRVMALYVSAFSFRQPYQLLLTNDFLLEAGKQRDNDVYKMLKEVVQGETKPMITQCCIHALYTLGKEYQPIVDLAKKCERRKCNHREAIDAWECVKEVVGPTNKHRYVLALGSPKLMSSLNHVPGLPIVHFNPRGVLVLSPPTQATIRVKNAQEEERRVEGAKVLDGVVDGANVVGADGTASAPAQRSRKAKAPNPLSMKKKKVKADAAAPAEAKKRRLDDDDEDKEEAEADGGEAEAGRRKKKRKRGRGKGAVAGAIAELKAEMAAKGAAGDAGEAEAGSGAESD